MKHEEQLMTMFGKRVEEGIDLFLEKNVPTNPSKWAYYKAQAKKKKTPFDW